MLDPGLPIKKHRLKEHWLWFNYYIKTDCAALAPLFRRRNGDAALWSRQTRAACSRRGSTSAGEADSSQNRFEPAPL
jgi:hypothetical protein